MLHHGPSVTANGSMHYKKSNGTSNQSAKTVKSNVNSAAMSIPIPSQASSLHRGTVNDSSSSGDSIAETRNDCDGSPITAFSRSVNSNQSGTPMNVYSMSPRSTSVMFQYYSTPRGYYQHKPVSRARSNDYNNGFAHRRLMMRTTSESERMPLSNGSESQLQSPPQRSSVLSGIPVVTQNDVQEDPRRRAWSESDSNKKSSMHRSRLSALRKLGKRLSRSGSLKKKKEDSGSESNLNSAAPSSNSLLKVEEGRQMFDMNESIGRHSTGSGSELGESLAAMSLHEEDETTPVHSDANHNNSIETTPVFRSPLYINPEADLIYQRFFDEHTCYDIMPTSCKLVVFDTGLVAGKAFHALIANAVRSAPLWDSTLSQYVGMLTVTDFIHVLTTCYRQGKNLELLEGETLATWRKLLGQQPQFESVTPKDTLLHSLQTLFVGNYHGVPIFDQSSGDILHIINHKRILRFLFLFMNELPTPSFISKSIEETNIGTYDNVSTVTRDQPLHEVLQLIVDRKLTAIPVIDQDTGEAVDVFCKLDMIPLAAQGLHCDLTIKLGTVLSCRFAPLFEDEAEISDAYTRFSSPKPQRRNIQQNTNNPTVAASAKGNTNTLTSLLDEYTTTRKVTTPLSASVKGHSVQRPNPLTSPPTKRPPLLRQQSLPSNVVLKDSDVTPRSRHKSMSNPLVKCNLKDTIQFVIDLLVSSDANLLVVVSPHDSKVVGVVTVADVLRYIIDPQGRKFHPSKRKKSTTSTSSHPISQQSSESSLPSDDLPFDCDDTAPLFRMRHRSSDHVLNDSGYTSSTSVSRRKSSETRPPHQVSFADQLNNEQVSRQMSAKFLRSGAQIERL